MKHRVEKSIGNKIRWEAFLSSNLEIVFFSFSMFSRIGKKILFGQPESERLYRRQHVRAQ
jgi:hypothetical protein